MGGSREERQEPSLDAFIARGIGSQASERANKGSFLIHDRLDAAAFDAYDWPADLTDEQIIEKLVALNAERAAEEKRGLVRWLRPEFQNPPGEKKPALEELDTPTTRLQ